MNERQKKIAFALLFMAATLLAASFYIKEKQEDYRSMVMVKLAEQETTMVRYSELLARESVDPVVSKIIKDCDIADRERFDALLGNLSQLNAAQLREVDGLFPACGSYFADRQAVLVARLTREIEMYGEYITLLDLTSTEIHPYTKRHELWKQYDALETNKSDLSLKLVAIQSDIIDLLIAGEPVTSVSINEKLKEAQTAKDSLLLLTTQAESLRQEISEL